MMANDVSKHMKFLFYFGMTIAIVSGILFIYILFLADKTSTEDKKSALSVVQLIVSIATFAYGVLASYIEYKAKADIRAKDEAIKAQEKKLLEDEKKRKEEEEKFNLRIELYKKIYSHYYDVCDLAFMIYSRSFACADHDEVEKKKLKHIIYHQFYDSTATFLVKPFNMFEANKLFGEHLRLLCLTLEEKCNALAQTAYDLQELNLIEVREKSHAVSEAWRSLINGMLNEIGGVETVSAIDYDLKHQ